jgi:hypothetical protein
VSLFPRNHLCHAQNVRFYMKFDTFFHGLLTKKDKLGDHCIVFWSNADGITQNSLKSNQNLSNTGLGFPKTGIF